MQIFKRLEYKFLFDLLRNHKRSLFLLLVFQLVLSVIVLTLPFLVKLQTDQLLQANTDFFQLVTGSPSFIFTLIIALVLLGNALEFLFEFFSRLLNERMRQKLGLQAENEFFQKLSHLDSGFLNNPRNRRVTSTIFQVSYVFDRALRFLPNNARNVFSFLGVVPVIFLVDYRIGIFTFVMSFIDYFFYRIKIKQENQITTANDALQQKVNELRFWLLYYFQKILLIDRENKVLKTYQQKRKDSYGVDFMKFKNTEKWAAFFWILENLTTSIITLVFGYQVLSGVFTIGDFTMITLYALQLKKGFSSLFESANEWRSFELDFLKLGFFLHLKPRYQLLHPLHQGDIKGDVVFEGVSFRYPNLDQDEREYMNFMIKRQRIHKNKLKLYYYDESEYQQWENFLEENSKPLPQVLENFSMTVKRGEITALIGRNGSGKTTATQLMVRSYDPEKGKMLMGGIPLKQVDPAHLRQFISVLTQEVFLIESFSIKDNLLLGVQRNVPDEEIWALLERFSLVEKISQLPKKLDTLLGDDIQFSGGQRQLMAIVRTYLQAKPFVIFDEGTNQLDAEHESRVMDFLQELKGKSTVLMITHKLTSARKADRIYVLDQGKIIEQGTHSELLANDGLYRKFWKLQVVD